jgi:hypothetical protein
MEDHRSQPAYGTRATSTPLQLEGQACYIASTTDLAAMHRVCQWRHRGCDEGIRLREPNPLVLLSHSPSRLHLFRSDCDENKPKRWYVEHCDLGLLPTPRRDLES